MTYAPIQTTQEALISKRDMNTPLMKTFEERDSRPIGKKDITLCFATTVDAKVNGYVKHGKLILDGHQLSLIPIKITNEIKESKQIVGNPNKDAYYFPIVSLNFDLVTAKLIYKKSRRSFKILVLGCDIDFEFDLSKTSSEEVYLQIVRLIQASISTSQGNAMNMIGVCLRPNFYNDYFISYHEFPSRAKSGDILIFRGLECPAKCQRCFTQADYDHVGVLYLKDSTLFVYESTSKDGVKLRTWREFVCYYWNLLYEKMVYRELIVSLPNKEKVQNDIHNRLSDFIKLTQGKKYRLKGCGLCFGISMKENEKKNAWDQSKGFFCSQLVAGAYYMSGVMPYVADSRYYLPGAFSRYGNIQLNKGFSLGPEYILEFSE